MFGAGSILGRVHKYLDLDLDLDFATRRRWPLRARARAPHAGGDDGGGGGDGVDRLRGCVVRASPPCTNHTHRTNPAHHLLRPRARARPSCLPSRRRAAASNARGPSEADSPGIPFPTYTPPLLAGTGTPLCARAPTRTAQRLVPSAPRRRCTGCATATTAATGARRPRRPQLRRADNSEQP